MADKYFPKKYGSYDNFRVHERERLKKLYWSDVEKTRKYNREKRHRLYHSNPKKNRENARVLYWKDIEHSRTLNRLQAKKHSKTRVQRTKERRWKKRLEIINALGRKCKKCGITNNLTLTFHHREGKDRRYDWMRKDFDITTLDLLCHNCHNILHLSEEWKDFLNQNCILGSHKDLSDNVRQRRRS